ncbi:hypothetical protein BRYFOR_08178 [Marvinbryantia formatexigens DSM 14469]|uniref:Uncharacterized protein n=1 Tax=Marvinbryantia formatexigens DSM 14469 TaxID=478749 RepID=C6LHR4_9FIRM|nr:hypothetical protein BRYFOR_08178 [Marvinbryantia formatexigens DSM 14469]
MCIRLAEERAILQYLQFARTAFKESIAMLLQADDRPILQALRA